MDQEMIKSINKKQESTSGISRIWSIWPSAIKRFVKKSGFLHASSLSYTTLVGIIPVLAVGLSVATSLMFKDGAEGRAEVEIWIDKVVKTVAPMLDLEVRDQVNLKNDQVDSSMATGPEMSAEKGFKADSLWEETADSSMVSRMFKISTRSDSSRRREVAKQIAEFVSKIHTRTIGMTSVIVFLMVAILLLRAIERTFNQVWEIPKNRTWGAGVAQYWAGLTLGPFLLIIGTGLSSSSTLQEFTLYLAGMRWFGKILLFVFSWVITGSACALIYRIMTNTRVTLKASICGGMTAGLLLQLNSQLSVVYFSNVATVNKIYGSLGAIPILLLGLYVSWIILIFGSHVAYLVQYPANENIQKSTSDKVDNHFNVLTSMRLLKLVAERFTKEEKALGVEELAMSLDIDLSDLLLLVNKLVDGGLLFRGAEPELKLTLAKPAECISLVQIYRLIEAENSSFNESSESDPCTLAYYQVLDVRNKSASDITIFDLVHSKPATDT